MLTNCVEHSGESLIKTPPQSKEIVVPADKAILHRALLCSALAHGETVIRAQRGDFICGRDIGETVRALADLGVRVEQTAAEIRVRGPITRRAATLRVQESGTTLRLLCGLLAGVPGEWTIERGAALARRPLNDLLAMLEQVGARITQSAGNCVHIVGGHIRGGAIALPTPSAQYKSALLLAALGSRAPLWVCEPVATRDHTERMLARFGVRMMHREACCADRASAGIATHFPITSTAYHWLGVATPNTLASHTLTIPGDVSSAAVWIVASTLGAIASATITDVGLNPRRLGLVQALRAMGANIHITDATSSDESAACIEPYGVIAVESAPLRALTLCSAQIPELVDELPLLAVAAACAVGTSTFTGVRVLRGKESDRLAAIIARLRAHGIVCSTCGDDRLQIVGNGRITSAAHTALPASTDHRIVMMDWLLRRLCGDRSIMDATTTRAVEKSYPSFWSTAALFDERSAG